MGMRDEKPAHYKRRGRKKLRKLFIICAVAAAAVLCLLFFVIIPAGNGANEDAINEAPAAGAVMEDEISYEGVDEATLAGLAGDESAFEASDGDRISEVGRIIGVSALKINSQDGVLLSEMEKAAAEDIKSGDIEDFLVYDGENDRNQQVQDIYAMVNGGVKTIILLNTDEYNYIKIADIASKNGISLVTYHCETEVGGFAADIRESVGEAAAMAEFLKSCGIEKTDILKGTAEQQEAAAGVLEVGKNYEDFWDANAEVAASIEAENKKESMMVLDYNGADMLKSWLNRGTYPRAYVAIATVNYIKTWYALLNGGYVQMQEVEAGDEDEEPESVPIGEPLQASAQEFFGAGMTQAENTGSIVYEFAYNLAMGKVLPEAEYVHELEPCELITNETVSKYYEQVKDMEGGLVYIGHDAAGIAELFEAPEVGDGEPEEAAWPYLVGKAEAIIEIQEIS